MHDSIYQLCVYFPLEEPASLQALQAFKEALFGAGAGRLGNYQRCCWQTRGSGQFEAMSGANPTLGQPGEVTEVEEVKLELFVPSDARVAVERALRSAHPYEEPAYFFFIADTQGSAE